MGDKYILVDGVPVICHDVLEWSKWFEKDERVVEQTEIQDDKTEQVSTVFLGLDHDWGNKGPPILFETMVFGGPLDQEIERYATLEEAKAGHAKMVARVSA